MYEKKTWKIKNSIIQTKATYTKRSDEYIGKRKIILKFNRTFENYDTKFLSYSIHSFIHLTQDIDHHIIEKQDKIRPDEKIFL